MAFVNEFDLTIHHLSQFSPVIAWLILADHVFFTIAIDIGPGGFGAGMTAPAPLNNALVYKAALAIGFG